MNKLQKCIKDKKDEVDIFEVSPKCNVIQKVNIPICDAMKTSDFITIHKKCKNSI